MAATGLTRSVSTSLRCLSAVLAKNSGSIHTTCTSLEIAKPTHTGQKFEEDDYRTARFEAVPRKTNERWAIDLIKEVPPKGAKTRVVACDGGPGALGHPRVYINLDQPGNHSCIYCGLRFFKEDSH